MDIKSKFLAVLLSHLLFFPLVSCASLENPKQENVIHKNYAKGEFKLGNSYHVNGKKYTPSVDKQYAEVGVASWYGTKFKGRKTANGSLFTGNEYTAAHRTLPLPSVVRVTNLVNSKSIDVVVNDRGPFKGSNRIIDLSQKAAKELGFENIGHTKVHVEYLHDKTLALLAMYPSEQHKKAMQTFRTAEIQTKKSS